MSVIVDVAVYHPVAVNVRSAGLRKLAGQFRRHFLAGGEISDVGVPDYIHGTAGLEVYNSPFGGCSAEDLSRLVAHYEVPGRKQAVNAFHPGLDVDLVLLDGQALYICRELEQHPGNTFAANKVERAEAVQVSVLA